MQIHSSVAIRDTTSRNATVHLKYANKSSIGARDAASLSYSRQPNFGGREGGGAKTRRGETGVCDSDALVVIVASAALTDFFPQESSVSRRAGRKRAEHTFPSIFVHPLSWHLAARARAPVVRNARILGHTYIRCDRSCICTDAGPGPVLVSPRNEFDETGRPERGRLRNVVAAGTYLPSRSIASFYGSPLTRFSVQMINSW